MQHAFAGNNRALKSARNEKKCAETVPLKEDSP